MKKVVFPLVILALSLVLITACGAGGSPSGDTRSYVGSGEILWFKTGEERSDDLPLFDPVRLVDGKSRKTQKNEFWEVGLPEEGHKGGLEDPKDTEGAFDFQGVQNEAGDFYYVVLQ